MIPEFDSFRLLWLGDWSLGKALGLSLLLALIIYLLYRSEIRKGTTGSLKWMLPTLPLPGRGCTILDFSRPGIATAKRRRKSRKNHCIS